MNKKSAGLPDLLDAISSGIGRATAWLTLLMVLVTFVVVVLRYAFSSGYIWLQESLTWMHAVVFMLGAAYTLQQEEHVRVDIFYRDMSRRRRAIVNGLGVLLFIFPLCGFFVYQCFGYASSSWAIGEVSRDSGGMPYPAIPLLKSLLILMPVTVALQGLSLLLRSWRDLRSQ